MKRTRLKYILPGLLLACVVIVAIEVQFKVMQRVYDNLVLDNRNHYLTCNDLPTKSEVETVMEQHSEVIKQIQQIAPESIDVEIDTSVCEGKADLLISYGTQQQRIAIEKILNGDTFFGIPYRLQNR